MSAEPGEHGRTAEPGPTSTLRWLFVLVPLAVIGVTGSNLLVLWTTAAQQAQREERSREAERAAGEAERERQQARQQAEEAPWSNFHVGWVKARSFSGPRPNNFVRAVRCWVALRLTQPTPVLTPLPP
jgi:type II secretory pathway pseudopilin PulG